MSNNVRLAVLSDMHYRVHAGSSIPRPANSINGEHDNPVEAFLRLVQEKGLRADYLVCPGDITDRAAAGPLSVGWGKLRELRDALGARHVIASTGNHEVDSRATDRSNEPGNAEIEVDPLGQLQSLDDYPSSALSGVDRKWVYWGRGYEFIEDGDILVLLINSSHFHPTTRSLEFERGKLGGAALNCLRDEMPLVIGRTQARVFIALLHHPPIAHESPTVELGRAVMFNGAQLIELLDKSGRPWLVVHGHKHHGRIVSAQGDAMPPVVFSAASAGALLSGEMQRDYRLQSYLLDLEPSGSGAAMRLKGVVSAYSWIDNRWTSAMTPSHGIADNHGFAVPAISPIDLVDPAMKQVLSMENYIKWSELVEKVQDLRYLSPAQASNLVRAMEDQGVIFTWPPDHAFPTDLILRRTAL